MERIWAVVCPSSRYCSTSITGMEPRRVGVKGPSPPAPSVLSTMRPALWAVTVMPPSTWQTIRFRSS